MESERRSNRPKKPIIDIWSNFCSLESRAELEICCICGNKSNNCVNVQENALSFTSDALNDLLRTEEFPQEIISAESKVCLHCHNLLMKILQLLEEIKKHRSKLKNTLANRHKPESMIQLAINKKSEKSGKEKQYFDCEICGKQFTRKASMLEHSARHKGIRDRECKVSYFLLHVYIFEYLYCKYLEPWAVLCLTLV